MSGKPKNSIYEYDRNGKFLQNYTSISEYRKKHYPEDTGIRPLFRKKIFNEKYQVSLNNTISVENKIGRDQIRFYWKIIDSKLCNLKETTFKSVEVLNLKKEVVAEFATPATAIFFLEHLINPSTVYRQLHKGKTTTRFYDDLEFTFRFK